MELEIEDLAAGGDGVARMSGMVVFIPGAITGDLVDAEITSTASSHARARVMGIVRPSPHRVQPACRVDGCGGCAWRAASYELQLDAKRKMVAEALSRLGGIGAAGDIVEPTAPSPARAGYRNRIRLHAGDGRLGFFSPRSRDLTEVGSCPAAAAPINDALAAIAAIRPWGRGDVEIRAGDGGHVQVILHGGFPRRTLRGVGGLDTVSGAWAPGKKPLGREFLHHRLGDLMLRVGPSSFFQINTGAARHLYETVRAFLGSEGGPVLDLYSGVGAAGLSAVDPAEDLTGVESSPGAVLDARHNALANGLSRASYVTGAVEDVLGDTLTSAPAVAIVNPPRAGCHPRVLDRLRGLGPASVVYVSCNPATLARDVSRLSPDYEVSRVRPVDMFPGTHHVETVALLGRARGREV